MRGENMIGFRVRFIITMVVAMAGRGIMDFILLAFLLRMNQFVYFTLYIVAVLLVTFALEKAGVMINVREPFTEDRVQGVAKGG